MRQFLKSLFVVISLIFLFSCKTGITLEYEVGDLSVIPMDQRVLLSWVEPTGQKDYSHSALFWGEITTFNKDVTRYKGDVIPAHMIFDELKNGVEYTFMVIVVDKWGNESPGVVRRVTPQDSIKPNEVSSFTAVKGSGKIFLSWTNPADVDFIKSEVWATDRFGVNTEHFFVNGKPGQSSSIEIAKLDNGYNYNFFVKAIDSFDNSSPVAYIDASPDGIAPGQVSFDLSFYIVENKIGVGNYYSFIGTSSEKGQQVKLVWTNPDDEDFDKVELWYGPSGMTKKFFDIEDDIVVLSYYDAENSRPKECSFLLEELENGKFYNFRISALDEVGNSADQDLKLVMPKDGVGCTLPRMDVSAGKSQILVNWDRPEDPDFKVIELFYIEKTTAILALGTGTAAEVAIEAHADCYSFSEEFPDSPLLEEGTLITGISNGVCYLIRLKLTDTSGNQTIAYGVEYIDGKPHPITDINSALALAVTPSENLASEVLNPVVLRGDQQLELQWTPAAFDDTILHSPIYVVYSVEQEHLPLPPEYTGAGADGIFGTADDFVGFPGETRKVIRGADSTEKIEYTSLVNGTRYYFKIFVIEQFKSDGTFRFSNGRVVSQIPDKPAGTELQDHSVNDPTGFNVSYPIKLSYLPAGEFDMGMPFFSEKVHEVDINTGLWVADYETSYGLWRAVYEWAIEHGYQFENPGAVSNGDSVVRDISVYTASSSFNSAGVAIDPLFDRYPVVFISWYDAVVWCNALTEMTMGSSDPCVYRVGSDPVRDSRLSNIDQLEELASNDFPAYKVGYRLPTEAEWEYAARYVEDPSGFIHYMPGSWISGDIDYYNGVTSSPDLYAWHSESSEGKINPVNITTRANGVGCYNMSGNVSELCWDWYEEYKSLRLVNPQGPASLNSDLKVKIHRGGTYLDAVSAQGVCFRGLQTIDRADIRLGFRVVRPKID